MSERIQSTAVLCTFAMLFAWVAYVSWTLPSQAETKRNIERFVLGESAPRMTAQLR